MHEVLQWNAKRFAGLINCCRICFVLQDFCSITALNICDKFADIKLHRVVKEIDAGIVHFLCHLETVKKVEHNGSNGIVQDVHMPSHLPIQLHTMICLPCS